MVSRGQRKGCLRPYSWFSRPVQNVYNLCNLFVYGRYFTFLWWDKRYCSWLWHYATSRMVAVSILDEVIKLFFNVPILSSRTTALELTQPLTEMSTMNFPDNLLVKYTINKKKIYFHISITTLDIICILSFIQNRTFWRLVSVSFFRWYYSIGPNRQS
jgi:hypothetical protein